jgi:arsenate reductase
MANDDDTIAVLFLCTGNSARSIMAEALLMARGGGRFKAYSAGSHPAGRVNPAAIEELRRRGHDTATLRSKSWDEFAAPGAPEFRYVFTVCDNAAGESCPVRAGSPLTVHWGIPDPAAVTGPEAAVREAFRDACDSLSVRIDGLLGLPLDSMADREAQIALQALGRLRS